MRPEKAALVGVVAGKIVKLRGHVAIPSVGSDGRKTAQAPGLITRGYPHNPKARRNPQPSPKSPLLKRRYGCSSQTRCRSGPDEGP